MGSNIARPTAVLKLHGSKHAKYERKDEPQPAIGEPERPDALDAQARKIWDRVVPEMLEIGVLTILDGAALARYCTLLARWWQLTGYVKKNGCTQRKGSEKAGYSEVARPEMGLLDQIEGRLLRLEQQFGLTPAARPSLVAHPSAKSKVKRSKFFG